MYLHHFKVTPNYIKCLDKVFSVQGSNITSIPHLLTISSSNPLMNWSWEPQPSMWFVELCFASAGYMHAEPHIESVKSTRGHREGPKEVACTFPKLYARLWVLGLSNGNMSPDWVTPEALSRTFTKVWNSHAKYLWTVCLSLKCRF